MLDVRYEIFLLICHLLFHSVSSVCSSLNFLKIVGLKSLSVLCLVAQSCLTLCGPIHCSPPGSSVHGDSPGKNPAVSCHALLQGIFPTHGSNPGFPHCRQILYCLSHQGNSRKSNIWAFTELFMLITFFFCACAS